MIKYEVNKSFPFPHPGAGAEITLSDITPSLFDVKCYLNNPVIDEIRDWKKGALTYAIFEQDSCPFFIIEFENWSLDCSINILKIKTDSDREVWLNAEGNLVNLYLIDATTNILKAMRTISLQKDLCEKLRDICEVQTERYENAIECEKRITKIQNLRTTDEMLKMSKKYHLK
ncbi:hypothetical protein SF1_19200 [Sphingobacterium faecium NBRC 15299]|uniref:hypothetical protein n=1 Tax=Sphingobacterium faecium TaxID=34087 RepID=UPI000D3391F4|nr:hypothetical protein [Sphingobacterium faecium]PTX09435.1 hypothetical protein C8N37_10663 [Sphingobacterium faecium]GEM63938.1 hypothetical protein SF1_19200 [Sphingobacterium faecium NBRC 15299]